jgi:hypothetical protein
MSSCLHVFENMRKGPYWGAVLFTAWFWQAAKNVWNNLIWWHPTVIVLYHVIQSCRKMTPKYWYKLQYRAHDVIREPMANQN